jgi:hypothetical protein
MQLSTSATSENQHYIAGSRKDVRNPGKGVLHGGSSLHARVSRSAYETAAKFLLEHADPAAHPPNRYRRTYTTTYTPRLVTITFLCIRAFIQSPFYSNYPFLQLSIQALQLGWTVF